MPEVDQVLGNLAKLSAESYRATAPRLVADDIMAVRTTAAHLVEDVAGRVRGFVEVQQGCDHRCTFCVIPFGRGNNRSLPAGAVVAQVRAQVAHGAREVVLTGVDMTGYGGDLPGRPALGALVRRVLTLVPDLPRLRLSSLDPAEIDDELWRLIAEEPRLMPHLHLSIQSGDDLILKRMKRRHSRAQAIAAARRARALRPDVVLGADLLTGFPTEDGGMFERSLDIIGEAFTAPSKNPLQSVDSACRALGDTHIRGILALSLKDQSPDNAGVIPENNDVESWVSLAREASKQVDSFGPLISFALAPSAPQRCSDHLLLACRESRRSSILSSILISPRPGNMRRSAETYTANR